MPFVISIFNLEYDKETIRKIIGDNPKCSVFTVRHEAFKDGSIEVEIPEKLLTMNLKIKAHIPREYLNDNTKIGKIGSFLLETPPKGKLAKNRVLKALATHYTTIDLFA